MWFLLHILYSYVACKLYTRKINEYLSGALKFLCLLSHINRKNIFSNGLEWAYISIEFF